MGKRSGCALDSTASKKAKIARSSKHCTICNTEPAVLKTSPTSCSSPHYASVERACGECWEAYLSMAVEESQAEDDIQCMFCDSTMPGAEIKRLAREHTAERHEMKIQHRFKQTCQDRCAASRIAHPNGSPQRSKRNSAYCFVLQDHEPDADGRVFACKFCDFATCVVCDRPEHLGEACEDYQARTGMLEELPPVQQRSGHTMKKDAIKSCPNCQVYWMLDDGGGCGFVKCNACCFRFCQRCLVPWVGEDSAYLVGKKAHSVDSTDGKVCTYRDRLTFSGHTLQNRFAYSEAEQGELAGRQAKKARRSSS
ncbi:hypothetical protein LTR53_004665 [Teratosphaeriaceae sp. CCFEE 6253]|nr:hypothetical protein LTR53_004665 [Teratosphaeriaceae sp. CCFEE 6253]